MKIIGIIFLVILLVVIVAAIIGLLFLKFDKAVGKHPGKEEQETFKDRSPTFFDGQFHNENEFSLMSGQGYPASSRRKPKEMIKAETPELLTDAKDDDLTFTWIGHSSFLLQLGDKTILVDPVFGDRSSPVSFVGPKRFSELPITADELPDIDVLLISHDHYDHMDYGTIRSISPKVKKFIVPLGVDSILRGWGIDDDMICSLGWWDDMETDGVTYTLTPSQHFTGRDPLRRNSTAWGGFFIDNGYHKVYYTGDGGYCDAFKDVNARLGAPDLLISECGQYDPSWKEVHMFPEESVQASVDVGAKWMIPVHWGTFCICNHAWDDPIIRVTKAAGEQQINIATPRIGQTVRYEDIASFNEAWWEEW